MSLSRFRYRQSKASNLSVKEQSQISDYLSQFKATPSTMHIQIGKSKPLPIPVRLQQQVLNILTVASRGSNVAVTPLTSNLTTQEAAEILGVSRPHIVSLLESKKIPSTKVGTHRRILRADLDAYLIKQNSARSTALTHLMRETQKLNLGYTTRKGS